MKHSKLALLLLGACVPDLDTDESTVTSPRVLAIVAEPAEAGRGESVTYRAIVADPEGGEPDGRFTWYHCKAPKPLAELGPINQDCLSSSSGALVELGGGDQATASLPSDACSLFGPNPPAPVGDEPPGRPADPDDTGGYKLPVLLSARGEASDLLLYEQRIYCGVAGVNAQTSAEFAARYRRNQNPSVERIVVKRANGEEAELAEGDVLRVAANEELELEVRWPSCPESDACGDGLCGVDESAVECSEDCPATTGCGGQERYLWLDPESRELKVRNESLRVAWYASAGRYEEERTGVDEERARGSRNHWTAPAEEGQVLLWVVVRDARGGVGYREVRGEIE